ncbi:MAG: 4Fe-4S binding protein [Anaerolineae bacterium]|nr:4Fe-4S binding protein [Candidatus Roseilinea sp.]MDW8450840.1 4Fe-4S binding protein [Anaerolineae bacterium]
MHAVSAHGLQCAIPRIDEQRCTGCGNCAALCPTQAVQVVNDKAVIVRPEACVYCDVCETFCPEGAIGRPFLIVFGEAETVRPLGIAA